MTEEEMLELLLNTIETKPPEETKFLWIKDTEIFNKGYVMIEDEEGQTSIFIVTIQEGKVEPT